MKATTVLTTLLTANLALGAMWTQKRRETRAANLLKMANSDSSDPITRSEGDSARTPSSRPLKFQEKTSASTKFAAAASTNNNTKTHSTYSQNWAGALLVNTKFTAVTGTIVVPTPSGANAAVQSAGAAVSALPLLFHFLDIMFREDHKSLTHRLTVDWHRRRDLCLGNSPDWY